jgi:hypothetical protein
MAECIDHTIVLGETHLRRTRRTMSAYAIYCNKARTHLSLGKDAPIDRSIEEFGRIIAEPMVGRLHHRYDPSVADGERVSAVYRRSVMLASERFAMLDDGMGFSPPRPAIILSFPRPA